MSRNPKKQCKMCGKPVESNLRFCTDCYRKRKQAERGEIKDFVIPKPNYEPKSEY